MSIVEFSDVSVEFPIYNANGRSLKKKFIQIATGGKVSSDSDGRVIVQALSNLNFVLNEGDRVALIGHNGAGKSTLLRVLSAVYWPTKGTVKIEGRIGSLIDISLGIDYEATGRENIFTRGAILGLRKKEIDEKINEIIDFSDLGDFIDMPVRTYSSGMNLRLAFSIATAMRPEILLMDEWLSVGDEDFRKKAENRMNEIVETTKILVVASHSKDLIKNVCNRVIWLEHGEVIFDGKPDQVLDRYFS